MAACEAILTALQSLDAEVICAVPGISSEWKARYNRLRIFDHPVDLQPLLSHADLAITYGAGTIATALLAGVPVMLVPQMAEQYLAGLPLERMGAGLMLREQQSIEQCASLINTLLTMPSYRQAAQAFAQRYANFSTEQACQRLWSAMKVKLEN
ncbi:Glycosyltransferase family 28 C-terminal domain [Solimicrobium silvestre]|uniref:Glycosyltransferase family 28 C-terminal domain n=2 Tax=Solimicrobium silvestre TaxID=2099400 RepID=A0A2S9H493_9BURK|nr:Glycosyltransferase family 28 C-terminal domain [Solimicrobium silvestre]